MRCVAVIEAERPGIDNVIVWDKDTQLVAFAYENGQVKMTRPLAALTLDDAVLEIQQNFQINAGQLHRVTDWTDRAIRPEPITTPRTRW